MKNLSGNALWFGSEKEVEKEETEEIIDDRVLISYKSNDISFFLTSNGKPLVFSNNSVAEEYIIKNNIENYEIDNFKDFDFTDIEIIEL